jgi:ribosomal protein S18 acetylase RimI-like enzyme
MNDNERIIMEIKEITNYHDRTKIEIDSLLELLLNKKASISASALQEIISSDSSHLFFAFDENKNCMGMLTVGIYISPTGKKAWIEDVVVGERFRGKGIGEALVKYAIDFVKEQKVHLLTLTSRPARIAANKLYMKLGFVKKETNVYKMDL